MKRKKNPLVFERNLSRVEKEAFPNALQQTKSHEYHGSRANFCNGDDSKYSQLSALFSGRSFKVALLNEYREFLGLQPAVLSVIPTDNALASKLNLSKAS
jgi:hypothetical protein